MKSIQLLTATMQATLAGCTTHLESGLASASNPESRKGIAYFLPITRFDVDVTWTVTDCASSGPVLAASFKAKSRTEPDPDALHVIDYTSLDAFTKTSAVKVEFYDSGAIKSINASAEDRTGAIIGHAISAVGKIGTAALGVAGVVSDETKCSSEVNEALKKLVSQGTAVDASTSELEIALDILEELTDSLAQTEAGNNDTAVAALKNQVAVVEEKKRTQQKKQAELAATINALTYTDSISFAATSAHAASGPAVIPLPVWKKWLSVAQVEATPLTKQTENAIFLEINSAQGWHNGRDIENTTTSKAAQRQAGIRYRIAVPEFLIACVEHPCTPPDNVDGSPGTPGKSVGAPMPVRVLNRATTFYLPFASRGFSDGSLEARFTEDGIMTFAGYDQKVAPGEVIAATADAAAGDISGVFKGLRGSRTSELQQTKNQTELINAQQELALARAAQIPSPNTANEEQTAVTEAETKLLEAQVAKANAGIALRKAQLELAAAAAMRDGK